MIINVIDQQGTHHTLEAESGWRIMEIIRDWGLNIKAECSGACSCATCHVYIAPEWLSILSPANKKEVLPLIDPEFFPPFNSIISFN